MLKRLAISTNVNDIRQWKKCFSNMATWLFEKQFLVDVTNGFRAAEKWKKKYIFVKENWCLFGFRPTDKN